MTNLQDICHLITDGKHGDCHNEEGSGYYFISCKDVKDGWVDYSGARQITEADYRETHKRTQLEPNDILITNSGTIGRMVLVPNKPKTYRTTFQKSVAIVKPNSSCITPQWLYYCLKARKDAMVAWAGGTAQKNLLLRDLRAFKVEVPPLPIQRKIACILSAYDNLIENNTRQIKILEEMAQAIYREWFVNFRFPGHEKHPLVESELGMIPEGWEVKKVSEIARICRGRSYRSTNLVEEGGLPFLNLKCIERDGGFRYEGIKRYVGPYKDSQSARAGDIIIAVTDMTQERRIVARAARVPDLREEPAVSSMDLVKIVANVNIESDYLYGMFRYSSFSDEVKQHASGVNVLHLLQDCIGNFKFPLATDSVRQDYANLAENLYQECDALQKKNANLRQTHDLLLPRLISGEIDVSELDIETGEEKNNAA